MLTVMENQFVSDPIEKEIFVLWIKFDEVLLNWISFGRQMGFIGFWIENNWISLIERLLSNLFVHCCGRLKQLNPVQYHICPFPDRNLHLQTSLNILLIPKFNFLYQDCHKRQQLYQIDSQICQKKFFFFNFVCFFTQFSSDNCLTIRGWMWLNLFWLSTQNTHNKSNN